MRSKLIIFLLLGVFLASCSDNYIPCAGFLEEPVFPLRTNLDSLEVRIEGHSDIEKIYLNPAAAFALPIDMNDDGVQYQFFYHDTFLAKLTLHYTLEDRYCDADQEMILQFTSAQTDFDRSSDSTYRAQLSVCSGISGEYFFDAENWFAYRRDVSEYLNDGFYHFCLEIH